MPLLLSGHKFRNELETYGCLAIHIPLEGGFETRLLRRLKVSGYKTQIISARGFGDPEMFLLKLHGIRPPHLGHQSIGRNGALGEVQQVMPQLNELLDENKKLVLWLLEGQVLSRSELIAICEISEKDPRLKIIVEMGGSRVLKWSSMRNYLDQAKNF